MMVGAEDHDKAESVVRHGERHGAWAVEGPIEIRGPIGHQSCSTVEVDP